MSASALTESCLPATAKAGVNHHKHRLLAAFFLPCIGPSLKGAADHEAVSKIALEDLPGEALGAAPGNALEAADEPAAASAGASGTALCTSGAAAVQALAWVHQLVPQQTAVKMACHLAAGRLPAWLAETAAQELP